eukprot:Seg3242.4 transcript_id=Seg3242.4/GoldUCD/mRNA.D3Y31 product="Heterogeneous nuclear ribonucleoprotein F" protein_id=Seg3242.4/GoldUCD/D3Y31
MKMEDQEYSEQGNDQFNEAMVVKLRGLPWSVTAEEIKSFLNDCELNEGEDIHLTYTKDGRPSGEAFVALHTQEDFEKALSHDKEHMGKRYIEVFASKYSEMEWVVTRMAGGEGDGEAVVRLRGLPYGAQKQDIAEFFAGLEIAPYGITITLDQDGRCTGDAYVQFASPKEADQALQKHKEKIGHRYIEIFKSSKSEIKYVVGPKLKPLMSIRPHPYERASGSYGGSRARGRGGLGASGFNDDFGLDDLGAGGFGGSGGRGRGPRGARPSGGGGGGSGRNGGRGGSSTMQVMNSTTGHSVHMRGLPFDSSDDDIMQFFTPLNPVSIRIIYEPNGRPKGEADVDFATHEAASAAMGKHKQNMGRRYIELFLQSSPSGYSGGWSGGLRSGGSGFGSSDGDSKSGYAGGYGSSYGGGYGRSGSSGYGSGGGYSGLGGRSRGPSDGTNFAADVTYPGAGNFFGQQAYN